MSSTGFVRDGKALLHDAVERCDVCVIGSGPGGAVVAKELAARGADVVVLEQGPRYEKADFTQREDEMLASLYDSAGLLRTRDGACRILAGRGLGGTTIHNNCLVFDAPPGVRRRWAHEFEVPGVDDAAWARLVARVRQAIGAAPIAEAEVNANNGVLLRGMRALGWSGGVAEHNRVECLRCGFCELGCPFERKRDMSKTYLPAAVERGARIYTDVRAERLVRAGDRVTRCEARVLHRASGVARLSFVVYADHYVLAAGALRTPQLLLASGLYASRGQVGRHLRLNPTGMVFARMPDRVAAWEGVPQSAYVDEFASFRADGYGGVLLLGGFRHPAGFAAVLPGAGAAHAARMAEYPRFAGVQVMLHDEGLGWVSVDRRGDLTVDYRLRPDDQLTLQDGLQRAARLLFEAGAERVLVPHTTTGELRGPEDLAALGTEPYRPGRFFTRAYHPQSTVRMGADPRTAAADPFGRLHGMVNVTVADASALPTSAGMPPQLTIMANATRVAWHLAGGPPAA